jgi:hypothetical protein
LPQDTSASRPAIEAQDEIDQSAFGRGKIRGAAGLASHPGRISGQDIDTAELARMSSLDEIVNPAL